MHRQVMLAGLIVAAIAMTARAAAQQSTALPNRPSFDAVSVRPNRSGERGGVSEFRPGGYRSINGTLMRVISLAYSLPGDRIVGGPDWLRSTFYDVEARVEGNPPREQVRLMMQSLLIDRFKLRTHRETRPLPVYALVLDGVSIFTRSRNSSV